MQHRRTLKADSVEGSALCWTPHVNIHLLSSVTVLFKAQLVQYGTVQQAPQKIKAFRLNHCFMGYPKFQKHSSDIRGPVYLLKTATSQKSDCPDAILNIRLLEYS